MTTFSLKQDWHVHSTFSDGADTLQSNIAAAESLGLTHLGCVDHVRRDTTYLPEYIAAVRAARGDTTVELSIGIEAKMLDANGELDLPADVHGVDLVYVADHQFPGRDGPVSPRVIRGAIADGSQQAAAALDTLVGATVASMRRYSGQHPLVLAHLFSIVPKLGLDETMISDDLIAALASAAAETRTIVEVSERWRCPSVRVIEACRARGVRIVASTDSHRSSDIAQYDFVAAYAGAAGA